MLRPLDTLPRRGLTALAESVEPWRASAALGDGAGDGAGDGVAAGIEAAWSTLEDPVEGMVYLADCASRNLERLREGEALAGQLLPYMCFGEGAEYGLVVDKERGLLNPLRAAREGVRVRHHGKYT